MDMGELSVYRGCPAVIDAYYGKAMQKSPVTAIVEAVSEAAEVDPVELTPLYEFVDTDALNNLFENHDGAKDAEAILSFKFESWNVFVRADGCIRVCDGTKSIAPEPVFESHAA